MVRAGVGVLARLGDDLVVEAVSGNEAAVVRGAGQQVLAVAGRRRVDVDGEGHGVADPRPRGEVLVVGQPVGAVGLRGDRAGPLRLPLDLDRGGRQPGGEGRGVVDGAGGRGQ